MQSNKPIFQTTVFQYKNRKGLKFVLTDVINLSWQASIYLQSAVSPLDITKPSLLLNQLDGALFFIPLTPEALAF